MRQLGPARLRRGPALGAAPRRRLRRRPRRRHDLRRVGRRGRRVAALRHAGRQRALPQGGRCRAARRSPSTMDAAAALAERAAELAGVDDVDRAPRPAASTEILAVQQQVEAEGADRTFVPGRRRHASSPTRPAGRSATARRPGSRCSSAPTSTSGSCGRRPIRTAATSTRTGCARASAGRFPADALDGLIDAVRDARTARGEATRAERRLLRHRVRAGVPRAVACGWPTLQARPRADLRVPLRLGLPGHARLARGVPRPRDRVRVRQPGPGRAGRLHRLRARGRRAGRADDGRLARLRPHRRSRPRPRSRGRATTRPPAPRWCSTPSPRSQHAPRDAERAAVDAARAAAADVEPDQR